MEENKVKSVSDYINALYKFAPSANCTFFYRGHSDESYILEPSIYRKVSKDADIRFIEYEHKIFREIIMRRPADFSSCSTSFEKLVKMQHYGLPTRLLDITDNPLVSLYFACSDNKVDGEVIMFDIPIYEIKYFDSDTVSIITNLAKCPFEFNVSGFYNDNLEAFNHNIEGNVQKEIGFLLHEIRGDKPDFTPRIAPELLNNTVFCVKAKMDNERIKAQSGVFVLFGIQKTKELCSKFPEKYVAGKIKIEKDTKEFILRELNILNINQATLFPEIQSAATYIKNEIFEDVRRQEKKTDDDMSVSENYRGGLGSHKIFGKTLKIATTKNTVTLYAETAIQRRILEEVHVKVLDRFSRVKINHKKGFVEIVDNSLMDKSVRKSVIDIVKEQSARELMNVEVIHHGVKNVKLPTSRIVSNTLKRGAKGAKLSVGKKMGGKW